MMKKTKTLGETVKFAVLTLSTALMLTACASKMDKADIPATSNPTEELAKLQTAYGEAIAANTDVLAPEPFEKGADYLDEAKNDLKSNQDQAEVIESLAYATSYLRKANEIAEGRRQHVTPLLTARTSAINAGATKNPDTHKTLKKLDREIEKASDRLDKDLTAERVAYLERAYLGLETLTIQNNLLGKARSQIQGSKDEGAEKRAPQTLKQADIAFRAAETAVASGVKTPETYNEAVQKANYSAQYLVDVMGASKKNGKGTTEAVAMQLVDQNRKIGNLEGNLERAEGQVSTLGKTVNAQAQAVTLQKALEDARRSFSKSEAEVFQQGRNLVIRLKTMNFASGRAELSQESLDILAKVSAIVNSLPAEKVMVEGHTDSTGNATVNQKLSSERAETVAKYLESSVEGAKEIGAVGYGYKKPIASNKSKQGRAQNRRVDVVVSTGPNAGSSSTESL